MTKRAMIESFPQTARESESDQLFDATDPMRAAFLRRQASYAAQIPLMSTSIRADRSIPIRERSHSRSHRAIR